MDLKDRLEARDRKDFPSFPGISGWDIWDKESNDWCKEGIRGPFFSKKKCEKAIQRLVECYSTMKVHTNR